MTFSTELAIVSSVASSTEPPTPMAKILAPWGWTCTALGWEHCYSFRSQCWVNRACMQVPVQSAKMSAGLSRSQVTADRPQTSCQYDGSERLQFHSRRRSQGTKDTHHVDKQRALGGEIDAIGC